MTQAEIEQVYEQLAQGIDAVGEGKSEIFLAKVALLLAQEVGDVARLTTLIEQAKADL